MFKQEKISFRDSAVIGKLTLDYLEGKAELLPFYSYPPDKNGFTEAFKKNTYQNLNRTALTEIVSAQCTLVNNTSAATIQNVKKLIKQNTFTITTGHQLCLFTGPLYFIYKIFSVINLAEELKREFPEQDFVPVYWMASEDHDFEEVNNFNLFGKNIKWHSDQGGAVGDFKTATLAQIIPQLKEVFGNQEHANELLDLFEKSYINHNSLAKATRYLVNELFGEYGLVTIDGNDPGFKKQFIPEFEKDIFENTAFKSSANTVEQLTAMGYDMQVNPRPINCFYLEEGKRLRIEKNENGFYLVNGDKQFSQVEMRELIHSTPEKISPNVVLRPLYQQRILPNLAYVGGPGELAYWLEYKKMFEAFGLFFPVLAPRNFLMVIDKASAGKVSKLGFTNHDIFKTEGELINHYQQIQNSVFHLNPEKENLATVYNQIIEKISATDKSLSGSVSAEMQKALNGLDALSAKANKAIKQKMDTEINQIKNLKQKLFPNGTAQERHDNFSTFYLRHGKSFMHFLKHNIKPFTNELTILIEQQAS